MPKHAIPEPITLPIPDPAPWDDVMTVAHPAEAPAPPAGPSPQELAAFLNGLGRAAQREYWAAAIRALDPPARGSLRQCLRTTQPAP